MRPIVKASIIKNSIEEQHRYILFPYQKINEKNRLIGEEEITETYPLAHCLFRSIKDTLDKRDKGKKNPVGWYAFGRSQGLDTSFGKKNSNLPDESESTLCGLGRPEYTFLFRLLHKILRRPKPACALLKFGRHGLFISTR